MEDFDPVKAWNEALFKQMNETPLESVAARLPPEGQAWLKSVNRFTRRVVEFDLRNAGPDQFVEDWKFLRDTLQSLGRRRPSQRRQHRRPRSTRAYPEGFRRWNVGRDPRRASLV
jgi:hypothetical protein